MDQPSGGLRKFKTQNRKKGQYQTAHSRKVGKQKKQALTKRDHETEKTDARKSIREEKPSGETERSIYWKGNRVRRSEIQESITH